MKGGTTGPETIDEYLAQFDGEVRARLDRMRALIRAAAPMATEKISYRIPTFFLHGNLVHFAGYGGHVGFYPGASGVANFTSELADYVWARGSIQLPHDRPIPAALVTKITKFRVAESLARAEGKGKAARKGKAAAGKGKAAAGTGKAAAASAAAASAAAASASASASASGKAKPAAAGKSASASASGKAKPAARAKPAPGRAKPATAARPSSPAGARRARRR